MSPDSLQFVVDAGRSALFTALKISLPLLSVGLVVGLTVSIIQAVTQIQEQTLAFIPKILAVVGTLLFLMPWIINIIVEFTYDMLMKLPENF